MPVLDYKANPIDIQAIQWTGDNTDEVIDFIEAFPVSAERPTQIFIDNGSSASVYDTILRTMVSVQLQDYITKDAHGNLSPLNPELFTERFSETV